LGFGAHNVASGQTGGFQRQMAQATAQPHLSVVAKLSGAATEGSNWTQDLVDQRSAKQNFAVHPAVLKTADQMMGSLLDTRA
jgi:hypothetical protein